jgi:protein Tex
VGVHQDGLVHVSAMSATFVSDPREVVMSGDVVRVKVLEVDEARKRISLTLRLEDEANAAKPERGPRRDRPERNPRKGTDRQGADRQSDRRGNRDRRDAGRSAAPGNSAMADALRRAGLTGK